MKSILYLIAPIIFLLSSCTPTVPADSSPDSPPIPRGDAPPYERSAPKDSDPEKQEKCAQSGKDCKGNDSCEEICNDLFTRRSQREDCEKLPRDLVFDFENLIESIEDGDIDDFKANTLECLLDIDDRDFSRAVKKLSRTNAKEFLVLIADDEEIARVLHEEDDEFNIFKQLFAKVSGSDLSNVLEREIDDGKTFLHIASENNEYAYKWINGYVDEECDNRDSTECPSGENIGAYCKALTSFPTRDLTDFLSDADIFSDEWQTEVEDNEFEYDTAGFTEFCKYAQAGALSTNCPRTEPPESFKLADITLADVSGTKSYYKVGHVKSSGGDAIASGNAQGSSAPAQDIIRGIEFGSTKKVWLDEGEITEALYEEDSFDRNNNWYIYIGDKRFALDHASSYTAGSVKYHIFDAEGSGSVTEAQHEVHLAFETENGNCRYVKP